MYEVLVENELKFVFEKFRWVPNVEIEVRLGWCENDRFNTNIGRTFYDMIHKRLETKTQSKTDVYTNNKARVIYDPEKARITSSHHKISLYTSDIQLFGTPFDLRVSVSVEKPVALNNNKLDLKTLTKVRSRDRSRFAYKMWNYELTKVKSILPACMYSESCNTYEFEIEYNHEECDPGVTNLYLAKSLVMKIMDVVKINDNETIDISNSVLNKCRMKRICF